MFLVHYGAPAWVASATTSILGSDIPVRVAIVDNGPPGCVLEVDPRVRVIPAGENRGYAGGANLGLREWLAGGAPYCVVGSHDLHVERDALRLLVAAADAHPDFGILGPAPIEHVARAPALARDGDVEVVSWISGTCMLLRRDAIRETGGFDEAFHSYVEDVDLCLRASDLGWRVGIEPRARVSGRGSSSASARRLMYVNHVRLRLKRESRRRAVKLVLLFPVFAARDFLVAIVKFDRVGLDRGLSRLAALPGGCRLIVDSLRGRGTSRRRGSRPEPPST